METFLGTVFSPRSIIAWPLHDKSPKICASHLSSATMTDWTKSPEYHTATFQITSNRLSSVAAGSKRTSSVSTTKSQLRQSNQKLVTILQNIQAELAAHRTIMLDIQSRVSHLENESYTSQKIDVLDDTLSRPRCTSEECQTWWEACQNFADNCSTPFNANDFFKIPERFSGFDFHFGKLESAPNTPPLSPWKENDADVDSILSSTSSKEYLVDVGILEEYDSSLKKAEFQESYAEAEIEDVNKENHDDIIERIMVFDKARIPLPPRLQSPPRGKSALILPSHIVAFPSPSTISDSPESIENITALPQLPPNIENVGTPRRHSKGILHLFTFKVFRRSRAFKKGKSGVRPSL